MNAKHRLWLSLLEIRDLDERLREDELRTLAQRAESQRDGVEPYRLRGARRVRLTREPIGSAP